MRFPCHLAFLFYTFLLCEAQAPGPCLSTKKDYTMKYCPEGWVRYKKEKCFKLFQILRSHPDAERSCRGISSTLAALTSDEERNFLTSYLMREVDRVENLSDIWLGGQKKESLIWFWSDLSPFSYTNWWPGHPALHVGPCVGLATQKMHFRTSPDHWGEMVTWNCSVPFHYICQMFQTDTIKISLE